METKGELGWCLLAAGVYGWDKYAGETLSSVCHERMAHPIQRFLIIGAIGATAAHLTGVVPRQWDIYYGCKKL
jgi:hypothetical protein